ncbi:MAG: hypothetical protein V4858_17145 [Pseudomonadota bacterium]
MTKAERNQQIIARIQRGEKRYVLALEYGLTPKTITVITIKAGLTRWSRFKRE